MPGCKPAAVDQGINRAAAGKITVMKQYQDRFPGFCLLPSGNDVQCQAVLALPVMPDNRTLMLDLYGRSPEILRFKHGL